MGSFRCCFGVAMVGEMSEAIRTDPSLLHDYESG